MERRKEVEEKKKLGWYGQRQKGGRETEKDEGEQ